MPLIVKDPRGVLTSAPERRAQPAQLERRRRAAAADDRQRLERMAARAALRPHRRPARPRADPRRPGGAGRRYVLHATDETVTEFAIEPYAADAPAARGRAAHGRRPSTRPTRTGPTKASCRSPEARKRELYDYRTARRAPGAAQQRRTAALWKDRCARELRARLRAKSCGAPLPGRLRAAHARGFADYFSTAKNAATTPPRGASSAPNASVGPLGRHVRPTLRHDIFTVGERPMTAPGRRAPARRRRGPLACAVIVV